jgi:hypothetical protein
LVVTRAASSAGWSAVARDYDSEMEPGTSTGWSTDTAEGSMKPSRYQILLDIGALSIEAPARLVRRSAEHPMQRRVGKGSCVAIGDDGGLVTVKGWFELATQMPETLQNSVLRARVNVSSRRALLPTSSQVQVCILPFCVLSHMPSTQRWQPLWGATRRGDLSTQQPGFVSQSSLRTVMEASAFRFRQSTSGATLLCKRNRPRHRQFYRMALAVTLPEGGQFRTPSTALAKVRHIHHVRAA